MNFVKYLLGVSIIVNIYYLYTYVSILTLNIKNVIPEPENEYPILTKQNLRGMSQEVRNTVKNDILNTLIDEHWNSIYRGVILATGQENVSSYTASLNCYQHMVYRNFESQGYSSPFEKIWIQQKLCRLLGSSVPLSNKEYLTKSSGKDLDVIFKSSNIPRQLYIFLSGDASTVQSIMGAKILYVPNRDLQYDEPMLTNINLAKHRIIQFNFNSTEMEDILETEIERKIVETFSDINITKTYSECCQKFILNWR